MAASWKLISTAQGVDLVLYGDSITESWVATACGHPCGSRCDGIPKVYEDYFGNYSSMVLAVGGIPCPPLLAILPHYI